MLSQNMIIFFDISIFIIGSSKSLSLQLQSLTLTFL